MNPYPTYKDSGLPWLGPIPEHWEAKRLKYLVSNINDQKSAKNEQETYIALEHIESGTGRLTVPAEEVTFESNVKCFRKHDVLFSKLRPYLAKAVLPEQGGVCVGELLVLRGKDILLPRFLQYCLLSKPVIDVITGSTFGSKMPRADWSFIGNLRFQIPNHDEQAAIVTYLDRKTADIERFITKKRQLIALLHEQKAAIINRAVTKGLNPDVPMKASGVEWLGEVPAHWTTKHLKYLFREVDRRTLTGEEGLLSLRLRQGLIDDPKEASGLIQPKDIIGYKITEPGEVVMNRMQASNGLFGVTPRLGLVSPDYAVFEPSPDVVPDYFIRLFTTSQMRAKFHQEAKGLGDGSSGFLRLYSDRFGAITVPIPPIREQNAVIAFINAESAVISKAISRIEREIELINEYRTTLISEAVTGKVDVREEAGSLTR